MTHRSTRRCSARACAGCPRRSSCPGRLRRVDVPVLVALLRHPREGVGLFDTGCSPRFFVETRRYPYRVYRHAILSRSGRARPRSPSSPRAHRRRRRALDRGLPPRPRSRGGLADFPSARVFCAEQAFLSVQGLRGWAALRERHLPGHVPVWLRSRATAAARTRRPLLEPLGPTHDLFGDGTVRLIALRATRPVTSARWCRRAPIAGAAGGRRRLEPPGVRARGRRRPQRPRERPRAATRDATPARSLWRARARVVFVPSHCRAAAHELLADPERRRFA